MGSSVTRNVVAGQEIAYAERTTDSAAITALADISGAPTITVPAGFRPYLIRFGCHWWGGVTGTEIPLLILALTDNTEIRRAQTVIQANNGSGSGSHGHARFPVPAAPVSYKLRASTTFGTSVTPHAGTTYPIYLHAVWL